MRRYGFTLFRVYKMIVEDISFLPISLFFAAVGCVGPVFFIPAFLLCPLLGLLAAVDCDAHGQYLLGMDIECVSEGGNLLFFQCDVYFEEIIKLILPALSSRS